MSDVNIQDLAKKAESGDGCAIKDALSDVASDPQHKLAVDAQAHVLDQVIVQSKADVKIDPTVRELELVKTDGAFLNVETHSITRVNEQLELYRFDSEGKNPVQLYDEVYDFRSRKLASRCHNDQGDKK